MPADLTFTKTSGAYDTWVLRGPLGATTFALGGIETHSPRPQYGQETPDLTGCEHLGGPCWVDGSSLAGRRVEKEWEVSGRDDAVIEQALRERYAKAFEEAS